MKSIFASCLILIAFAMAAAANTFHVSTGGNDSNSGTEKAPLRTIQHAADLAQPCDVITVHEGVYRERVTPPRGGKSDRKRITYQAAPGEKVEIKGAEIVTNWTKVQDDVWQAVLPNSFFGGFNPFGDLIRGDWFNRKTSRKFHTGEVYLNGDSLLEATNLTNVLKPIGSNALWFAAVDATNTTLWAQFKGVNPNEQLVEVNVRQTVFYPAKTGINYLTVRGFIMSQAATPWAPPTAEQIGLIGTHWSKGWIIESNTVSHSVCAGISLGKYGDEFDNTSANTAAGYVGTINRALTNGWNKATIGQHLVRGNIISHCGQAGIVGSLGCAFSTITGNVIHDIDEQQLLLGAEMAGIKFHGAVDMEISHNHIYRCCRGIWLDWMAQGTCITRNLLHDNNPNEDLFVEVDHGPFLADNNLFLSQHALLDNSQGGAYVHNLVAGRVIDIQGERRQTPYLKAHSTAVIGLHGNPTGDDRFFNNLLVRSASLTNYDRAILPMFMNGNVFLNGAQPSKLDKSPLIKPDFDPAIKLMEKPDGFYLEIKLDPAWRTEHTCKLVTSKTLGRAVIPNQSFENPDGSPLKIDTDYFGQKRNEQNPFPGPFEISKSGTQTIKVWPTVSSASLAH